MKATRIGIIGGIGSETSCTFCLNLNNEIRKITNTQPSIVLENLPISAEAERKIINGQVTNEHLQLIKEAIIRLNKINVELIVIPCNTVHTFIKDLRSTSTCQILSIIEETTKQIASKKVRKVGILASTKTINEKLYATQLNTENIELVLPKEQEKISKIILRILNNTNNHKDKDFMNEKIRELKKDGAEAVIIGCTDLSKKLNQEDHQIPLIHALSALQEATITRITQDPF
ncbi:amino acid racemase [Candidatus Woesearchaeota archaeon]|jgi:aspartate racemase|nr:amino acid racemase [Candidatus Woesearchaeota archaeon]MBT3537100.1 amino acid racemase [Candidatus Woesearchaeota archaeon]MBT4697209.1 amino acid racemase [Candidatus Woesearchaeota archaeon]MBT4716449.1 amino acid racemase [Candidatus Woesearchaeota archaeon]MBT7106590.1 amino acid racemase [Candidatus Woesearchaeota archaeon]